MKNLLLLVGLIALGVGAYFLYNYLYQSNSDEKTNLILGGVFSAAALICFQRRRGAGHKYHQVLISRT
jgi:hypothetical protein